MEREYDFLANALNNLDGAVWIVDSDITETRFANTRFLELISVAQVSVWSDLTVTECVKRLGNVFNTVDWQDGNTEEAIGRLRDTPKFETVLPTKDGRHMRLNRYPDDKGCAVINFTDVTELVQASQKAKQAEISKTTFLANMSHEIRTPMNGVVGMTEVLASTNLDERQRSYVDLIARSGKSLVAIINDILDFSKIESGDFSIHPEPFNLADTIQDVISLMGHTARSKGLELILDMPNVPNNEMVGDSGRLRQVLINLVGNAIKFTSEGYVKLSVHLGMDGNNARVNFSVSDTGIGIPEDKVDSIFKKFAQADGGITQSYGGTGLGLTISQQLVNLMEGHIGVTSQLGSGSEFSFVLELPVTGDIAQETPTEQMLCGTPVLVIDDMPVNHIVLSNQLIALGAKPLCMTCPETALDVMKKVAEEGFRFPLIISDFQMPGMNGLEFVKALRGSAGISDTPVLILSSVDLSSLSGAFADLGVPQILEKPCLNSNLRRAIAETLSAGPVKLPIKEMAQRETATLKSQTSILAADQPGMNRDLLVKMLTRENIDLTLVSDGPEALGKFKEKSFDIVLLNICNPDLDGINTSLAMRRLETQNKRVPTPIIAMATDGINDDREEYSQFGINDLLNNPIDQSSLFATLEKWSTAKKRASTLMAARYAKAS